MIAASFLVKDLLLDWRLGEGFFYRRLVDGDPASNNGGWQWAASTGTDAQPWFRIFNPVSQGEKFDPDGSYVRRFVPELAHCEDDFVHAPWRAEAPPRDYPAPISMPIGSDRPRRSSMTMFGSIRATFCRPRAS